MRDRDFLPPRPATPVLSFEWDMDLQYEILGEQDEDLAASLDALSGRAQLGFSLACAEWLRWWLGPAELAEHLDAYVASRWVLLGRGPDVDLYLDPRRLDATTVSGSVFDCAIALCENTFTSLGGGSGKWDAALASLLVTHVLPSDAGFETWQREILPLLEARHPAGAGWDAEDAVFREDFAPAGRADGDPPSLSDAIARAAPFLYPLDPG